jgi:hypothetical protein
MQKKGQSTEKSLNSNITNSYEVCREEGRWPIFPNSGRVTSE